MPSNPKKRPYHAPKLKIYGDISQLTQNTADAGDFPDGAGMSGPNKTF